MTRVYENKTSKFATLSAGRTRITPIWIAFAFILRGREEALEDFKRCSYLFIRLKQTFFQH